MPYLILAALVALLLVALATACSGIYESHLQLDAEDAPPEEMMVGARLIFGAIALAGLAFGLLALWGAV